MPASSSVASWRVNKVMTRGQAPPKTPSGTGAWTTRRGKQAEPGRMPLRTGRRTERCAGEFRDLHRKEAHFFEALEGFGLIGGLQGAASRPALGVDRRIRVG